MVKEAKAALESGYVGALPRGTMCGMVGWVSERRSTQDAARLHRPPTNTGVLYWRSPAPTRHLCCS